MIVYSQCDHPELSPFAITLNGTPWWGGGVSNWTSESRVPVRTTVSFGSGKQANVAIPTLVKRILWILGARKFALILVWGGAPAHPRSHHLHGMGLLSPTPPRIFRRPPASYLPASCLMGWLRINRSSWRPTKNVRGAWGSGSPLHVNGGVWGAQVRPPEHYRCKLLGP